MVGDRYGPDFRAPGPTQDRTAEKFSLGHDD